MELRIGQILSEQGVLSGQQVEQVLERQRRESRPFGLICEELFHIPAEVIENAWAAQYAKLTRTIDPAVEVFEPDALGLLTRRQAWQFRILPIRFDDLELMIATTQMHLRKALRFASSVIPVPLYFVMAKPHALGEALCKHYPLPGMTPASVNDSGLENLLGRWSSPANGTSRPPTNGWMSKTG